MFFSCWAEALCRHNPLPSAFQTGLGRQAARWEAPLVSSESKAHMPPDLRDPCVRLFLLCFILVLLEAFPVHPELSVTQTASRAG